MRKKRQIEVITSLLIQSDCDYVDSVYRFLIEEDIKSVKYVLGDDDYEALKHMILEEFMK